MGIAAFFYSFGTLSGISFSDVTPATNVSRMLALLESMVSIFYIAILISRLVALHMAGQESKRDPQ